MQSLKHDSDMVVSKLLSIPIVTGVITAETFTAELFTQKYYAASIIKLTLPLEEISFSNNRQRNLTLKHMIVAINDRL